MNANTIKMIASATSLKLPTSPKLVLTNVPSPKTWVNALPTAFACTPGKNTPHAIIADTANSTANHFCCKQRSK